MTSRSFLFFAIAFCILTSKDVNGQVIVGSTVVPKSTVVMRPSLPIGLYCSEPTQATVIGQSERMRVIDVHKLHCAVFLIRIYAEVECVSGAPENPPRRGFIRDPDKSLRVLR